MERYRELAVGRSMRSTVYTGKMSSYRFSSRPSLHRTEKIVGKPAKAFAWSAVRWRRRQPHGDPAFRVHGEQAAERRAVHDRQIRPVRNVVGNLVHIDRFGIQGTAQA